VNKDNHSILYTYSSSLHSITIRDQFINQIQIIADVIIVTIGAIGFRKLK